MWIDFEDSLTGLESSLVSFQNSLVNFQKNWFKKKLISSKHQSTSSLLRAALKSSLATLQNSLSNLGSENRLTRFPSRLAKF